MAVYESFRKISIYLSVLFLSPQVLQWLSCLLFKKICQCAKDLNLDVVSHIQNKHPHRRNVTRYHFFHYYQLFYDNNFYMAGRPFMAR